MKMDINLGNWTQDKLDHIMHRSSKIKDAGSRINFLSRQFLSMDYKESTLIGDANTEEVFVINLEGIDCFTYIDYIEAMRLSGSFSEFKKNLKKVRYRAGEVAFKNRNHFFTDWREFNSEFVDDATEQIGAQKTKSITKILNQKEDGTYFLEGIYPREREIKYIPSDAIDDSVMDKMKTGDYAGIYSEIRGLDISHVGIIIKDRESIYPVRKKVPAKPSNRVYLRHASSEKKHRKVINQDFKGYISNKPGLIVLRPI
jgi:hypothetical protein